MSAGKIVQFMSVSVLNILASLVCLYDDCDTSHVVSWKLPYYSYRFQFWYNIQNVRHAPGYNFMQ
jgi:hypothetical protein